MANHKIKEEQPVKLESACIQFENGETITYDPNHLECIGSKTGCLHDKGCLSTEDSGIPGNFGLKDQAMEIQWVSEEIIEFGGTKSITIFVESGGGGSPHSPVTSPLTQGEKIEYDPIQSECNGSQTGSLHEKGRQVTPLIKTYEKEKVKLPKPGMKKDRFQCHYCGLTALFRSRLKRHLLTHTREKTAPCGKCPYKATTAYSLKNHISAVHLKKFQHKCEQCSFVSCYLSSLKKHIKMKHSSIIGTKCNYCDYSTRCKSTLNDHIKSRHLKIKDRHCPLCDFKSSRQSGLKQHYNIIHLLKKPYKKYPSKEFVCYYCSKVFKIKDRLKYHILEHLQLFSYCCKFCDYKTNNIYSFRSHKSVVHFKSKPFACKQCNYRAGRSDYLKKHIDGKHSSVRQHVCPICSQTFTRAEYMRGHLKKLHQHTSK